MGNGDVGAISELVNQHGVVINTTHEVKCTSSYHRIYSPNKHEYLDCDASTIIVDGLFSSVSSKCEWLC
jgi:hypothetical protein